MTRGRYNKISGKSVGDSLSKSIQGSEYLANYGQRPLKKPVVPTYVNNFAAASWISGASTITNDAVNYIAGSQALKFTKSNTGTTEQAIELSANLGGVDWSGTHIYVRFYLHEGSGASLYSTISTITLSLIDSEGASDNKVFNLYTGATFARSGSGWHEAAFTIEESEVTEQGTFNATLIDRVRFAITTSANADVPATTIDQILVFPKPTDATVMIRLDDGWSDQYGMAAYANAAGIPVTIACIKEHTDLGDAGNTDYLSNAQLRLLQGAGNLICNHTTMATDPNLTLLSDAEFRQRIVGQMQWMCENGLSRGSRIFIVPQGKLLNSQVDIIEELADFVWFIEDDGRAQTNAVGQGIAIDYDRFYCSGYEGQYAGRNAAALNAKLAQAITAKGVYGPFWHTDSTSNYEAHIDQIAIDFAAGDIVATMPDRYINRNE